MKKFKNKITNVAMMLLFATLISLGCKKEEFKEIEKPKDISLVQSNSENSLKPMELGVNGGLESGLNTTSYVPPGFVVTPQNANYDALHRLYNVYTNVHMLAGSEEALMLVNTMEYHQGPAPASDWVYEGSVGNIYNTQQIGTVALYRYYKGSNKDHYFTTSSSTPSGYVSEGVAGYVYTSSSYNRYPVYLYYKTSGGLDHLYTRNYAELGGGNSSWAYEGIAFYTAM